MATFNLSTALSIYSDTNISTNPFERNVDWRKSFSNITVNNPTNDKFLIPAGGSKVIFNGSRSTAIDNTSAFSIALNAYNSSIYRITNTGGTAPAFRTDRALALTGSTITVAINNNATATFTTSIGNFSAVLVGDILYVPNLLTGDNSLASPFNLSNGGIWVVLAVAGSTVTVARPAGQVFSGVAEAVTLTSNPQLQAFSSDNIQIGDTLEISSGFSAVTQKAYIVTNVTPTLVEFISTENLPLETGITPTATGMVFYSAAKRYVKIEADQEVIAQFNGDTGVFNRITPRAVASKTGIGFAEKWGTAYSLTIVNRSKTSPVNVVIIAAE